MRCWEPSQEDLRRAHGRAREEAVRFSLPFRKRRWRGPAGHWTGVGTGSSIDFYDHRHYNFGDDPRYINWQNYARSNQLTMKLYREETAPTTDLVFDISSSMAMNSAKAQRSLELLFFCLESIQQHTQSMGKLYFIEHQYVHEVHAPAILYHQWPRISASKLSSRSFSHEAPALHVIPWRAAAMRIVISDCLYRDSPEKLLAPLEKGTGSSLWFCPFTQEEATPPWQDEVELHDIELDHKLFTFADAPFQKIYIDHYTRHFSFWQDACRRRHVLFARIESESPLFIALQSEALPRELIEPCL